MTEGESRNDTLRAIRSVMEVWLEVAEEDGYAPLVETAELIAQRIANVLEDRDQSGWDRTLQTCMVEVRAAVAA